MRILNRVRYASHTLETKIEANRYHRQEIYGKLAEDKERPVLAGSYDREGFRAYSAKNIISHYKGLLTNPELKISSIGVGTYKGSCDESDDLLMFNGLVDSLNNGCNVLDSCRNFRGGRSQIVAGRALNHLVSDLGYSRNNFFLSSKAGYVRNNLPASVKSEEVVNQNCISPLFLEVELERSLQNYGVKTLDVYYLNNAAECQLQGIDEVAFYQRLEQAFRFLEEARAKGKINFYGLSSWRSFRVAEGENGHVSLEKMVKLAQKVGGATHGFKFVQLPISILMPEAFAQKYANNNSFLDTAEQLKINVISNSPLLSGTLINVPLPAGLMKCNNNGAKHLQLIRSIPSKALVSTLIGQKLNRHVKKNLQVLSSPLLSEQQWLRVFVPSSEARAPEQQRESL